MARRGILAGFGAALLGLLSGCDSYVVTRVNVMPLMSKGILHALSTRGGIPAEIHGTPFAGVEAPEIAENLKLPAGLTAGLRFRPVAPGGFEDEHDKARLVLIFNGAEPPGSAPACRLRGTAPVNPPEAGRFTLHAVFCDGRNWFGEGFLEAKKIDHGDWTKFGRLTANLFSEILNAADSSKR